MTGIYIHIPFCERKCPYCDFYSMPADDYTREKYTQKICENILHYKDREICVDTIYFGGGTPSLMTVKQIEKILQSVYKTFRVKNPEITVEANPNSANFSWLSGIKKAGVNRISFGVQSARNKELEILGRLHDFESGVNTIENAVKAGFENISADLMIGLPYQNMENLDYSLEKFVNLPVKHISAYMLKVEKGTAFDRKEIISHLPSEDMVCDMYLHMVEFLENKGFFQYEISNFAKNNMYSRHNVKYWKCEDYLGFGCSAHSFFDGERYFCPKNLKNFLESEIQPKITEDENPDKLEEYVMLGLRLSEGINFEKVKNLSDESFMKKLKNKAEFLEKGNFCKIEENNLSLTPKGFLVSNEIIEEFLELR